MPIQEVETLRLNEPANQWFFEQLKCVLNSIRQRAKELSALRGYSAGRELDDWLAAEREMFFSPPAELSDCGASLKLRVFAPGFDPKHISVAADPNAITIQAAHTAEETAEDATILFSEFSGRTLFRRFTLEHPIDPGTTSALYEDGVLCVRMPKAAVALLATAEHEELTLALVPEVAHAA